MASTRKEKENENIKTFGRFYQQEIISVHYDLTFFFFFCLHAGLASLESICLGALVKRGIHDNNNMLSVRLVA